MQPGFSVWDGVYPSFKSAPRIGPGFDGALWRDRSLQAAREAIARAEMGDPLDYSLRQRNAMLPVVTATLLGQKERVRILDFGGALGAGYAVLTSAVPQARERVDYRVVDVESICRAGTALFKDKVGPQFEAELPRGVNFDLIHSASTLQYIEDWKGIVARLADYRAPYMVFADVFSGTFASYATSQNYYDSKIPHWFLNREEIVHEASLHGYDLACRVNCDAKVLGAYGELPMDNFPPELRIPHTSHFLFRRQNSNAG
jgi:putative methyltransferase (TIGR04325 family)